VNLHHNHDAPLIDQGGIPSWKDWLFRESLRRYINATNSDNSLTVSYRTMILLWLSHAILDVNIGVTRPGQQCYALDDIPLPSTKELWEASSQKEWETEYWSYLSSRKSTDMLKVGHLRNAQQIDSLSTTACTEDLKNWSANLDSFGGLLMMAIGTVW